MAKDANGVSVTERQHDSMAFEVRVSPCDFDHVQSKINIVKTLAASFSGLALGEQLKLFIVDGTHRGDNP